MHKPIAVFASLLAVACASGADLTPEQTAFFESKIRPILADKCYKCHSVEKGKAKGGLTLDSPDGVKKGGEDGAVLVPGDPDKSRLIVAVRYTDTALQMPPKGEKLSADEVAALEQWVKMGAPDPRKAAGVAKLTGLTEKAKNHWAYQPVRNPPVPAIEKNAQWCRTPVDRFILANLQRHGMYPSPQADKETLLRRACYDLTGLPPEPRDVTAFLADTSPDAYEKIIDRLLASPHYGERWGRFWLDTARYADTVGRNVNSNREDYRYTSAWTYRDYVIEAFNADKPYDRFILEQLAADRLPSVRKDDFALAALGFLTVGERFNNNNDVINDRIDAVAKGFLGMTVTCARCHDHKFDPIPTADYYALHGVFASIEEPKEKPVVRMPDSADNLDFQTELAKLEQQNRATYYHALGNGIADFQKKARAYLQVASLRYQPESAAREKERRLLFQDNQLDNEVMQQVDRRLREDNDPVFMPYRLFAELKPSEFWEKAPKLGDDIAANKLRQKINPLVAAAFKTVLVRSMGDVQMVYGRLFAFRDKRTAIHLGVVSQTSAPASSIDAVAPDEAQILEAPFNVEPPDRLTTAHLRDIAGELPRRLTKNKLGFTFEKMNELELTHAGAPARAMVVADKPNPQNTPVFIRGESQNQGPVEPRHFLSILSPGGKPQPFRDGSGRLELARAIASKNNPLTARVLVNRVWMHHFGEGFVRTPDDLGNMAEEPSQPELLDWLATWFMENGWSLKKLHRLIMLSRVYQESSFTHPDFEKVDPQNRLLWRANIRRLDFEAMRDTLLALSGRLDLSVGGKPVNITEEPYSFRRSVYGYIDRGNLPELMLHFDFGDPEMPNSRRNSTIVPQQALFLMNSPMVVDVARRVAARPEVAQTRNDMDRILLIYRVVFQRTPKQHEIQIGLRFIHDEQIAQARQHITTPDDEAEKTQKQMTKKAKEKLAKKKGEGNEGMREIYNKGEVVERKPLNPWETYVQALLLSNEASYVN